MTHEPFLRCDNHLSLASQMGLGPHRLEEIEVVGARIEDVRYGFRPCWDDTRVTTRKA